MSDYQDWTNKELENYKNSLQAKIKLSKYEAMREYYINKIQTIQTILDIRIKKAKLHKK